MFENVKSIEIDKETVITIQNDKIYRILSGIAFFVFFGILISIDPQNPIRTLTVFALIFGAIYFLILSTYYRILLIEEGGSLKLKHFLVLGGAIPLNRFDEEIEKIVSIVIDEKIIGPNSLGFHSPVLSIELSEGHDMSTSVDLLLAPLNSCFQLARMINQQTGIKLKWSLTDSEFFHDAIPSSYKISDPPKAEKIFFPQLSKSIEILPIDDTTGRRLSFNDRNLQSTIILFISVVILTLFSWLLMSGEVISVEISNLMAIMGIIIFVIIVLLRQLLRASRRTQLEIRPGRIGIGWKLPKFEKMQYYDINEVKAVFASSELNQHHKLIFLMDDTLRFEGRLINDTSISRTVSGLVEIISLYKR